MAEDITRKEQARRPANRPTLVQWLLLAFSALLILGGVGFYAYMYLPFGGNGPRLQLVRDRLDLGDQHLDTVARASFEIRNGGDRPLSLAVPKTATVLEGCWPGDVFVGQTTLFPGESTTLYTNFMMHAGMGGRHLFEIVLTTNDPTQPTKRLLIQSNWVP